MKKYNLLVVGNGFDLNFKFKTKYSDFCEYLRKSFGPAKNKLLYFLYRAYDFDVMINENWTSFEKVLCQYLEFLNYLFTSPNVSYYCESYDYGLKKEFFTYLTITDINKLPLNCKRVMDIGNPLDGIMDFYWFDTNVKRCYMDCRLSYLPKHQNNFDIKISKCFTTFPSKSDIRDFIIGEFNKALEDAEDTLATYIRQETSKTEAPSAFVSENIGTEVDYLVSFNYSKTAESIYNITPNNVTYVHGCVDGEIVLGVENDMLEEQEVQEDSPYLIFFKKARRFIKRCNEGFSEKILNKITPSTKIAVFGHSLDKSDKSIFQLLLNSDFNHCDIYYFGEEKEYRSRLISLVGIDTADKLNNNNKISFIKIV